MIGLEYTSVDEQADVVSEPFWTKRDGDRLADVAIKHIKNRAASGQNAATAQAALPAYSTNRLYVPKGAFPAPKGGQGTSGGRTVRYDAGYGQYKGSSTPSATPNLRASGAMLDSMSHVADKDGVTIGVDAVHDGKVKGLEAQGRTFLGLNKGDMDATEKVLQSILDSKDLIVTPDISVTDGVARTRQSGHARGLPSAYARTVK